MSSKLETTVFILLFGVLCLALIACGANALDKGLQGYKPSSMTALDKRIECAVNPDAQVCKR